MYGPDENPIMYLAMRKDHYDRMCEILIRNQKSLDSTREKNKSNQARKIVNKPCVQWCLVEPKDSTLVDRVIITATEAFPGECKICDKRDYDPCHHLEFRCSKECCIHSLRALYYEDEEDGDYRYRIGLKYKNILDKITS